MKRLIFLAIAATMASFATAQLNSFTLSHGSASYSEGNLIGPGTRSDGGLADFKTRSDGPDNMFQNWWWYNTQFTSQELALGNQVSGSTSGNEARVVYQEDAGPNHPNGLIFDINYTLTQISSSLSMVQIGWKIHNLTNETLRVNFFSYTDLDLNGTSGDDTGTFVAPNQFQVGDADPTVGADLIASSTSLFAWEQGAYASVRTKLTNGTLDNLSNSIGAFGPGDWTGAFQWQFSLAANGTPNGADQMVGSMLKIVNNPVPEPATMVALAAGLGALASRRRRR